MSGSTADLQLNGEDKVSIKVIVELQVKPGLRAELKCLLESIVAEHGAGQAGFLGSTRYEVLDNPDVLVEIADWESAEARAAHMQEAAISGVYAPLMELLAAPFRATVIRQLP
jgi:quinol monooxygenase YgiN